MTLIVAVASTLGVLAAACSSTTDGNTCTERGGRTEKVLVNNADSIVYLPPCHDGSERSVYLLHGAGMGPTSWTRSPIDAVAQIDALITSREIRPTVVVFASDSTLQEGFPELVFDPLSARLAAEFGVEEDPDLRGIGGFSAGGTATALSAFDDQPRVGAVGFFAAAFPTSLIDEVAAQFGDRTDRPSVRVDVGESDGLIGFVGNIEDAMAGIGIVPEVTVVPGGHDFDFIGSRLGEWLRWFDANLA